MTVSFPPSPWAIIERRAAAASNLSFSLSPGIGWMEASMCGCWRRIRGRKGEGGGGGGAGEQQSSSGWNLFIDLKALETATDNFSEANLLGQGGFGPVYKGVMENGQEIAVKKLSLNSRQGVREFTNEVKLLLKVQHRNLVSLLGCCIASEQKMLVYPYIRNRSLDHFLFDKNKAAALDWSQRFGIIVGVAKGLLYLHEESPVKIIHRDIKASNILLDDQLNPKIADFGLARLFEGDDTHINTFKISGTHGYMAPEYALNGYLSAKTDVFSFGIMMLEIVSGRKNLEKGFDEDKSDILSYAWKLFEEGNSLEIMDPTISSWNSDEAALCIQIALLCCQAIVSDRPDMYTVHLMLSTDSFSLPRPGRPGICGRVGRWTSTPSSILAKTNTTSAHTNSSDTTNKVSTINSEIEDHSRNSISVSFTTEGR